jgi:hypothetical protein
VRKNKHYFENGQVFFESTFLGKRDAYKAGFVLIRLPAFKGWKPYLNHTRGLGREQGEDSCGNRELIINFLQTFFD